MELLTVNIYSRCVLLLYPYVRGPADPFLSIDELCALNVLFIFTNVLFVSMYSGQVCIIFLALFTTHWHIDLPTC